MFDDDNHAARTRRAVFARIAARAGDRDVRRAERLLLRGLERRWPDARIHHLLHGLLLKTVLQASPGKAA